MTWAKARFGRLYLKDLEKVLNQHNPIISSPKDVDRLFSGSSNRRKLWFGVRNLLKYAQTHGWTYEMVRPLLDAMPRCLRSRPDLTIPRESAVLETLRRLNNAPLRVKALYGLVLDSALRPYHALEIIMSFDPSRLEPLNEDVYRYQAVIARREKHLFITFVSRETAEQIKHLGNVKLTENYHQRYARLKGLIGAKHIQKFSYNAMRRCGIDIDVAEFISGRKPQGIGSRHYADLIMLAENQYQKYFEYLMGLRRRAEGSYSDSSKLPTPGERPHPPERGSRSKEIDGR